MRFVLCPRCELNYIMDNEPYCKVCLQEMHGTAPVEEELCSVCHEMPVVPGYDMCAICLREMKGETGSTPSTDSDGDRESQDSMDSSTIGEMDSVTSMDEILPDTEDNSGEYGELDHQLSLENMREVLASQLEQQPTALMVSALQLMRAQTPSWICLPQNRKLVQ